MSQDTISSCHNAENLIHLQKAYGCVFCMTGKEQYVAENLEYHVPQIRARAVCQMKRQTRNGITTLVNDVILHGYVLFEAPENLDAISTLHNDEVISILTYSDGSWRLFGDDEEYAKMVFHLNGCLKISKAHQIGDRIQIVEGPLKELEGAITRIDRRNRNGQVALNFGGKLVKVWLGFEIIKEYID